MTENQALNYIHSLNRFGIKPGLERITALLDKLGNPQNELSFIHVAGTNGKGSTSTAINNIMQAAGKKTGLFISPFVLDFKERIQVNNKYITADALGRLTSLVAAKAEQVGAELSDSVTEFEFITAVAFLYFKETNCDVVVLETGLGGRLDSTNVIKNPVATVITKIALDHMAVLGNTISDIALEKCGIIKSGKPVITSSKQDSEALSVIVETANEKNSELKIVQFDSIKINKVAAFGSEFVYRNIDIAVNLPGRHQIENMSLAVETALTLGVKPDAIQKGIFSTVFPARLEVISKQPLVLLDGAHNENGATALAGYLDDNSLRPVAIIGMMQDKSCEEVIKLIASRCSSIITVTVTGNSRAASGEQLSAIAKKYCDSCVCAENYLSALNLARQKMQELNAPLVICGSLYLASDIRNIALTFF